MRGNAHAARNPARNAARLLFVLVALLLLAQKSAAQSLTATEEAAIADAMARLRNEDDDAGKRIGGLAASLEARGRLAAAATLYKAVISEVDKPATYLNYYAPPIWVKPTRTNRGIITATLIAYPGLIELLAGENKIDEALEYADMMRAKILRAVIERDIRGTKPFVQFSPMPASRMRALAKDAKTTFVVFSLLKSKSDGKPAFKLLTWVIQPSGNIGFDTRTIAADSGGAEVDDSDPILVVASAFTRGLRRGVVDRLRTGAADAAAEADAGAGEAALRRLHDTLISRIEKYLPADPSDNVVIVPDGSLYLVPFAALTDSSGRALIERHTLSIAPSVAIHSLLRQKAVQKTDWSNTRPVLVVGNPKMPDLPSRSALKGTLPPLQGAEREADAIAKLFRTRALKGQDALEDVVTERMADARLIHFATHGLLIDAATVTTGNVSASLTSDMPPGAIVLADNPKKRRKIAEDDYTQIAVNGFLSSGKILKLKLNADLVTLSACDTARGRLVEHDFAALPSALMAVGARSVLMTLWSIPDAPTAELMPIFYTELLAGRSKAAALRHAVLETKRRYPEFDAWGAFTLIGSPD